MDLDFKKRILFVILLLALFQSSTVLAEDPLKIDETGLELEAHEDKVTVFNPLTHEKDPVSLPLPLPLPIDDKPLLTTRVALDEKETETAHSDKLEPVEKTESELEVTPKPTLESSSEEVTPTLAPAPVLKPKPDLWTVVKPLPLTEFHLILIAEDDGGILTRIYRTPDGKRVKLVDVDKVGKLDATRHEKCFSLFGMGSKEEDEPKVTPPRVVTPSNLQDPSQQNHGQSPYFRPNEYAASSVSFPTRYVSRRKLAYPMPLPLPVQGRAIPRRIPFAYTPVLRINYKPVIQDADPASGSGTAPLLGKTTDKETLPSPVLPVRNTNVEEDKEEIAEHALASVAVADKKILGPTELESQKVTSIGPEKRKKKAGDPKGRFFWNSYYDYYDYYDNYDYPPYPHYHHSYWSGPYNYFRSLLGFKTTK